LGDHPGVETKTVRSLNFSLALIQDSDLRCAISRQGIIGAIASAVGPQRYRTKEMRAARRCGIMIASKK